MILIKIRVKQFGQIGARGQRALMGALKRQLGGRNELGAVYIRLQGEMLSAMDPQLTDGNLKKVLQSAKVL